MDHELDPEKAMVDIEEFFGKANALYHKFDHCLQIIDCRDEDEFHNSDHIRHSKNLPYHKLLDNEKFLSSKRLAKVFEEH